MGRHFAGRSAYHPVTAVARAAPLRRFIGRLFFSDRPVVRAGAVLMIDSAAVAGGPSGVQKKRSL